LSLLGPFSLLYVQTGGHCKTTSERMMPFKEVFSGGIYFSPKYQNKEQFQL
jgi:hypothetical protein